MQPRPLQFVALAATAALHCIGLAAPWQEDIDDAPARLRPDAWFAQIAGGSATQAFTGGMVWSPGWHASFARGQFSAYLEASLGRWWTRSEGVTHTAWVTQLGVTPVLRWRGDRGASPWFAEMGVGANLLAPVFRNGDREFSTTFNFGDHVGVGYSFGAERRHEIALRIQHFSNAGIKHPNPGINFAQVRYTFSL